jgi:hypothetical protein
MENVFIVIQGCEDMAVISEFMTLLLKINNTIACFHFSNHYYETLSPVFKGNEKCNQLLHYLDFYHYEVRVEEQLKSAHVVAVNYYLQGDHIRTRNIKPSCILYIYDGVDESNLAHFKRMAEVNQLKYYIILENELLPQVMFTKLLDDVIPHLLAKKSFPETIEEYDQPLDLTYLSLVAEEKTEPLIKNSWDLYIRDLKSGKYSQNSNHIYSANV